MFYCTEVTQMLRVGVVEAAGFSTGPGQSEWRFVHGAPTGSICIALPGHSLNMQIQTWTRNCGCGTPSKVPLNQAALMLRES